jgi:hypothetical protein
MSKIPIYSAERQLSPSKSIYVDTLAAIVVLTVGLAVLGSVPAVAQVMSAPEHKPGTTTKTEMVPSLIVMNAQGASLQGGTLTLNGVTPSTIVFADRPVRAAGHMLTAHLVARGSWCRRSQDDTLPNPSPQCLVVQVFGWV